MSEEQSLKTCFKQAEAARRALEGYTPASAQTKVDVASALKKYELCLEIAEQVALFSTNEGLEDVASRDLEYFLIHFRISELVLRQTDLDRKSVLLKARKELEAFLRLLDSYDILNKEDAKMYERYKDAPDKFSTASTTDAAARRNTKIARHKEEKALKTKLEHLSRNPSLAQTDDDTYRDLHLTSISYATYQSFASLESIAQELHILSLAPPTPPPSHTLPPGDSRDRTASKEAYSDRLDQPLSSLLAQNKGPILDKSGKPLRPFTILDRRTQLQQGVFRPDHSLPTMSIDEYLEEERRRGGIIEGGGAKSGIRPEVDEDDLDLADRETMKAREWDEFKEDNPRGSGNTMNMG